MADLTKVNFVVLNKQDGLVDDAAAAAAAVLQAITVTYQPKLLLKSDLDPVTDAKTAAAAAAKAAVDTPSDDTKAEAAAKAAAAEAAAKDAIGKAVDVNNADVAKDPESVLILIPTINEPANINLLAGYVKIEGSKLTDILKDGQTVIYGGKKSKSKKQRKNKANKRKSVRH
jgi:hypothetical protein